jgi:hypothetical protein
MITPVGLARRVLGIIAIDDHPTRFSNFMSPSYENQPRRNEENEERTEKIFVLFVSSWLIFIVSARLPRRYV